MLYKIGPYKFLFCHAEIISGKADLIGHEPTGLTFATFNAFWTIAPFSFIHRKSNPKTQGIGERVG